MSLKLNFTPNTSGCYGLIISLQFGKDKWLFQEKCDIRIKLVKFSGRLLNVLLKYSLRSNDIPHDMSAVSYCG